MTQSGHWRRPKIYDWTTANVFQTSSLNSYSAAF
jgi:hypothetical protein